MPDLLYGHLDKCTKKSVESLFIAQLYHSCLGNLFTSVLNVTKYVEYNRVLGEDQVVFRKVYSTIDGIFILQ